MRRAAYPVMPHGFPRLSGRAGCPRVAQPFFTASPTEVGRPFDLHVLGAPPAFILSRIELSVRSAASLRRDVSKWTSGSHSGTADTRTSRRSTRRRAIGPAFRASLICPSSSDLSDTVSGSQGACSVRPCGGAPREEVIYAPYTAWGSLVCFLHVSYISGLLSQSGLK